MQNKVTNKKQNLLERLATLNERVYQAMLLKEQFLSIYTDPQTAGKALKEWVITAIKSKIPAFVELGTSSSENGIIFSTISSVRSQRPFQRESTTR